MTDAHEHLQAILNAWRRTSAMERRWIIRDSMELANAIIDADEWDKETE